MRLAVHPVGMNTLDWSVLAVLGLSALVGVLRGAAYEFISLGGWVAAFAAAHAFAPWLATSHLQGIGSAPLRAGVAWGACFVVTLLAAGVLASVARLVLRATGLGLLDRSMGALFGFVRGGMLVLAALFAAHYTALPQSPVWRASVLVPPAQWALDAVLPQLPFTLARAVPGR